MLKQTIKNSKHICLYLFNKLTLINCHCMNFFVYFMLCSQLLQYQLDVSRKERMQLYWLYSAAVKKADTLTDENVMILCAAVGVGLTELRSIIAAKTSNPFKFKQKLKQLYSEFYFRLTGEQFYGTPFLGASSVSATLAGQHKNEDKTNHMMEAEQKTNNITKDEDKTKK